MIDIKRKEECVGCKACGQSCPKQCISFYVDEQGFNYPEVNVDLCIDCHLCEKVCPVIEQTESRLPLVCFAAKSSDRDVLMNSSSGGIFSALASMFINEEGVVFGAVYNDKFDVVHSYAETMDELQYFRGSKYVQSDISDNYIKVESLLKSGKAVMFTGTPCQILGLKNFLRKEYENLLLVDVACHAVPSPKIWRSYISTFNSYNFNRISFRDKRNGWKKYGFSLYNDNDEIFYQSSWQNPYMQGFLSDLYTRPSCVECPAKSGKSGSDITLADCWGIEKIMPDFDYKNGASAIIVRTSKGVDAISKLENIIKKEVDYNLVIKYNTALIKSVKVPNESKRFWNQYEKEGINCIPEIIKSMKPSFTKRLIKFVIRKIKMR